MSHTSQNVYFSRVLTEGPLLLEESRIPGDNISLYALSSSSQEPHVRGPLSKSPPNIFLDVKSSLQYLSHPQVDSHTTGFSENVSMSLIYCNYLNDRTLLRAFASEHFLSAEGGVQKITSLPLSLSVSHWLRETNNKMSGSYDAKALKQHKDCLQACRKGMVGSEVVSASQQYHIYDYVVEPAPQVLDMTTTYWPALRLCRSRLLNSWPGILSVCYLTLIILKKLPPSSSSSSSKR